MNKKRSITGLTVKNIKKSSVCKILQNHHFSCGLVLCSNHACEALVTSSVTARFARRLSNYHVIWNIIKSLCYMEYYQITMLYGILSNHHATWNIIKSPCYMEHLLNHHVIWNVIKSPYYMEYY